MFKNLFLNEKISLILLISFIFISCKKSNIEVSSFNCSFLDTEELNLYHFTPFSAEQWKTMDYSKKLSYRQIPNDFLNNMSVNELFIQFINMDMAKDILLFNTPQKGIREAINNFNILQELYIKTDVIIFFITTLKSARLEQIENNDCYFGYFCLQMLSAQKEVTNKMNELEIITYIDLTYEIMDDMTRLSLLNDNWKSIVNYTFSIIAFANIMIKYNYAPFNEIMQSNDEITKFLNGQILLNEEIFTLVNDHMLEFYPQLKK